MLSTVSGRTGAFSIIHFHNLEGLTANCLKLAKESGAKVVFSLHNYWAVCPQVFMEVGK